MMSIQVPGMSLWELLCQLLIVGLQLKWRAVHSPSVALSHVASQIPRRQTFESLYVIN